MEVSKKAYQMELNNLTIMVQNEMPSNNDMYELKSIVIKKAEWSEVNDLIIGYNNLITKIDSENQE